MSMTFTGTTWKFSSSYNYLDEDSPLLEAKIDVSFSDYYKNEWVALQFDYSSNMMYWSGTGSADYQYVTGIEDQGPTFRDSAYMIVTFTSEPTVSGGSPDPGPLILSSSPNGLRSGGESDPVIDAFEEFMTENATRIDNISLSGTSWIFNANGPWWPDVGQGIVTEVPISFTDGNGDSYSSMDYFSSYGEYGCLAYITSSPRDVVEAFDYNDWMWVDGDVNKSKITFTSNIDSNFDSASALAFKEWFFISAERQSSVHLGGTTWVFNSEIGEFSDFLYDNPPYISFTTGLGGDYNIFHWYASETLQYGNASSWNPITVYEFVWEEPGYRIITFVDDGLLTETVGDEFYDWLSKNANQVGMELDGTRWKFEDVLSQPSVTSGIVTAVPISLTDGNGDNYDGINYSLGVGYITTSSGSVTQVYTYNGTWATPESKIVLFTSDISSSFDSDSADAFEEWFFMNANRIGNMELTGTTWLFDSEILLDGDGISVRVEVPFTTKDGTSYDGIQIWKNYGSVQIVYFTSDGYGGYYDTYVYDNSSWVYPLSRMVTFSGDADGSYDQIKEFEDILTSVAVMRGNDTEEYKTTANDIISIADAIRLKKRSDGSIVYPSGIASAIYEMPDPMEAANLINLNGIKEPYSNEYVGFVRSYVFAGACVSSVSFPNCTAIGEYAFYNNTSLRGASFPKVVTINAHAFDGCTLLSSADFPSCERIYSYGFVSCRSLKSISFPKCSSVAQCAFSTAFSAGDVSVYFPSCRNIGPSAFYYCRDLTSVDFPVLSIVNTAAFISCSKLTTVSFPACTFISSYGFQSCSALQSVYFPSCTTIGQFAFSGCKSLSSISFPKLLAVSHYAFSDCVGLTSVDLSNCGFISSNVFLNCSNLTTVFAPSMSWVGGWAFKGTALASADFPALLSMESNAFVGCSSLVGVSFPVCSIIPSNAFMSCSRLASVYLPSCQTISASAFVTCYSLTSISLPSCTYIGSSAFLNCSSLAEVYAPNCSMIGASAFAFCSSLSSVTFGSGLRSIHTYAFYSCGIREISAPGVQDLATYVFYGCSQLVSASFGEVLLSVPNYTFARCDSLRDVNISHAKTIGVDAFASCYALQSVSFPYCEKIETWAFNSCSSLTTAYFGLVSTIGSSAFQRCYNLVSLYLMGGTRCTYGTGAFSSTPVGGYSTSAGRYGSIFVPGSMWWSYTVTGSPWQTYNTRIVGVESSGTTGLYCLYQYQAGSYLAYGQSDRIYQGMVNNDDIVLRFNDLSSTIVHLPYSSADASAISAGTYSKSGIDITSDYGVPTSMNVSMYYGNFQVQITYAPVEPINIPLTFQGGQAAGTTHYNYFAGSMDASTVAQGMRNRAVISLKPSGGVNWISSNTAIPINYSITTSYVSYYASAIENGTFSMQLGDMSRYMYVDYDSYAYGTAYNNDGDANVMNFCVTVYEEHSQ